MKKAYLAADMLNKPAQLMRAIERDAINEIGTVDLFNPMDNKEINDKSKKPLAERIFEKDTEAILESEIIIADISQSIGTTVEMGQIWGLNYMRNKIADALRVARFSANSYEEKGEMLDRLLVDILTEIPHKTVYWKTEDIRDTDIEEKGYRRSHSYNQYLIGCLLEIGGEPKTFEEILEELKNDPK